MHVGVHPCPMSYCQMCSCQINVIIFPGKSHDLNPLEHLCLIMKSMLQVIAQINLLLFPVNQYGDVSEEYPVEPFVAGLLNRFATKWKLSFSQV